MSPPPNPSSQPSFRRQLCEEDQEIVATLASLRGRAGISAFSIQGYASLGLVDCRLYKIQLILRRGELPRREATGSGYGQIHARFTR